MDSNWISVKDRLPEPDTYVLVAWKKSMHKDGWTREVAYISIDDGLWTGACGRCGCDTCGFHNDTIEYEYFIVTHWQPLPDSPEE